MANENVRFWAFSTGNEPLNGIIGFLFVHFMSLGWTAGTQVGTSSRYPTNFDEKKILSFHRGNG